jgi:hypothetical protein
MCGFGIQFTPEQQFQYTEFWLDTPTCVDEDGIMWFSSFESYTIEVQNLSAFFQEYLYDYENCELTSFVVGDRHVLNITMVAQLDPGAIQKNDILC